MKRGRWIDFGVHWNRGCRLGRGCWSESADSGNRCQSPPTFTHLEKLRATSPFFWLCEHIIKLLGIVLCHTISLSSTTRMGHDLACEQGAVAAAAGVIVAWLGDRKEESANLALVNPHWMSPQPARHIQLLSHTYVFSSSSTTNLHLRPLTPHYYLHFIPHLDSYSSTITPHFTQFGTQLSLSTSRCPAKECSATRTSPSKAAR